MAKKRKVTTPESGDAEDVPSTSLRRIRSARPTAEARRENADIQEAVQKSLMSSEVHRRLMRVKQEVPDDEDRKLTEHNSTTYQLTAHTNWKLKQEPHDPDEDQYGIDPSRNGERSDDFVVSPNQRVLKKRRCRPSVAQSECDPNQEHGTPARGTSTHTEENEGFKKQFSVKVELHDNAEKRKIRFLNQQIDEEISRIGDPTINNLHEINEVVDEEMTILKETKKITVKRLKKKEHEQLLDGMTATEIIICQLGGRTLRSGRKLYGSASHVLTLLQTDSENAQHQFGHLNLNRLGEPQTRNQEKNHITSSQKDFKAYERGDNYRDLNQQEERQNLDSNSPFNVQNNPNREMEVCETAVGPFASMTMGRFGENVDRAPKELFNGDITVERREQKVVHLLNGRQLVEGSCREAAENFNEIQVRHQKESREFSKNFEEDGTSHDELPMMRMLNGDRYHDEYFDGNGDNFDDVPMEVSYDEIEHEVGEVYISNSDFENDQMEMSDNEEDELSATDDTGDAAQQEESDEQHVSSASDGDFSDNESQRPELRSWGFNPTRIQNIPPAALRSEGDQKDLPMSSTSSKRRNTINSRCASLLSVPIRPEAVAKTSTDPPEPLDSDDDDMSSTGRLSENSKRPRTPRGRFSPEAPRKAFSRLSVLSVDVPQNADLNVDGSGPSSSSAVSCGQPTPDSDRLSQNSHRKKISQSSSTSRKKRKSLSPRLSQDNEVIDSDDSDDDLNKLPIVSNDPSYILTQIHKDRFSAVKKKVSEELEFSPSQLAEIYKVSKGEQARLPESIYFGKFIMKTWYGSPFPAEYINVEMLYICEFCFFYARSDPIMQYHAKKCTLRAPPGIEIYRKGDISVFEVDGRIQKEYCQTLCLVSRMFLESKTVFYDTEPFFFYVATINDEIGCHFAGYFSKEKYEPDVNNLSCIMTLPCYQERGLGRFLIDVSYALSRKEKWFGGPEQPLSDLGKKAYGGYWRTVIALCLEGLKDELEYGPGISIKMIADITGVNCHDILEVVCSLGWARPVDPDEKNHYALEWDVDWDMVSIIRRESDACQETKIQYDETCLDWSPRKMKPSMDGYHELSKEEIEQDELKRKSIQKTPIPASMEKATPTSTTSMPVGSVKKELRSRGHNRSVGRNLKLELTRKVKVPEWAEAKEVTDEESREDNKKNAKKKIKKSFTGCADSAHKTLDNREDSPEDDTPGPSNKPPVKRRRGSAIREKQSQSVASSENKNASTSTGKGRKRNQSVDEVSGKEEDEEEEEPEHTDAEPITSDDDRPFGITVQKEKSEKPRKGRRSSRKRRQVGGKQFPPNFGVMERDDNGKKKDDDHEQKNHKGPLSQSPDESMRSEILSEPDKPVDSEALEESVVKTDSIMEAAEAKKSKIDKQLDESQEEPDDQIADELQEDYIIGTPESYHSSPPLSPQPLMDIPHQHLFGTAHNQFEENDGAPPLLVSEVNNLSVSEPAEPLDEGPSAAPALGQNLTNGDGYSTEDDDAPPRLSPQFGKNEDHEEEIQSGAPLIQHNGVNQLEDPSQQYHDTINAAPSSSMHITPQLIPNSQQNMMTSTPQQPPYSHPNSHQQTTPGSGGIPSCGPVYNHNTPEQQNQQFMSPQMAGMPASVSSVHSVHNNNSMEMVGGPSSLQPAPQQQYDIGHSMGQMPQDNGIVSNTVSTIEQQNQMMMQQHGFNSPPRPPVVPTQQAPQQVQQPSQVAPVVAATATTNGRRRSESAATQRKQRQQRSAASGAHPAIPSQMTQPMHMMPQMQPMSGYPFYQAYPAYPAVPSMWQGPPFYPNTSYQFGYMNHMSQMDPAYQQWVFNNTQMPDSNGIAGPGNGQFPPGASHMPYFQNNMRQ